MFKLNYLSTKREYSRFFRTREKYQSIQHKLLSVKKAWILYYFIFSANFADIEICSQIISFTSSSVIHSCDNLFQAIITAHITHFQKHLGSVQVQCSIADDSSVLCKWRVTRKGSDSTFSPNFIGNHSSLIGTFSVKLQSRYFTIGILLQWNYNFISMKNRE